MRVMNLMLLIKLKYRPIIRMVNICFSNFYFTSIYFNVILIKNNFLFFIVCINTLKIALSLNDYELNNADEMRYLKLLCLKYEYFFNYIEKNTKINPMVYNFYVIIKMNTILDTITIQTRHIYQQFTKAFIKLIFLLINF